MKFSVPSSLIEIPILQDVWNIQPVIFFITVVCDISNFHIHQEPVKAPTPILIGAHLEKTNILNNYFVFIMGLYW